MKEVTSHLLLGIGEEGNAKVGGWGAVAVSKKRVVIAIQGTDRTNFSCDSNSGYRQNQLQLW